MKKQWKSVLIGFVAGMLIMLMINGLVNAHSTRLEQNIEMQQEEKNTLENQKEQTKQQIETSVNWEETQENIERETRGCYISDHMQISVNFTKQILLYEYIEYGVRKYNEENNQTTTYSCDIEEDMLLFDTEFCMINTDREPYKTDLAKEIIPELANNIYNFRLSSQNNTIYMSIDTYNMKIYVYDAISDM